MNKIQKITVAALVMMSTLPSMAQGLNSAYFTDDYKFRHDLNPAYGNEQNYIALPMLGNINVATHGNFGYEDVIMHNPRPGANGNMTTFLNPYISAGQALDGFSSGDNRIAGEVSIAVLSAGFKAFGGYNTVEINARTSFGLNLPYELFEFAKNTGNKHYDIGDIDAQAMGFAELAFGHSRQINKKLRLGAKMKFLFGLGRADVKMRGMQADLSSNDKWTITGQATADASIKGFRFKEKVKEYNVPNADGTPRTYKTVDDVDVDGYGLSGFGMAVDLGGEYKIDKYWTVSAAVTDLGFISWSDNAQAKSSGDPFEFNGFKGMSVEDNGNRLDDELDAYGDDMKDFMRLENRGNTGGRTTGIGARLIFGASYVLPCYDKMKFGLLSATRINGPYSWTEGRLSANWTPLKWLDGGMSVAVNSFTTSAGWVLNVHPKGYNFFVGMDHILGKTSKEMIPLSSNASINMGMSVTF